MRCSFLKVQHHYIFTKIRKGEVCSVEPYRSGVYEAVQFLKYLCDVFIMSWPLLLRKFIHPIYKAEDIFCKYVMRAVEKCRTYILVDSAYLPELLKVETDANWTHLMRYFNHGSRSSAPHWKVDLLIFRVKIKTSGQSLCSDCCAKWSVGGGCQLF